MEAVKQISRRCRRELNPLRGNREKQFAAIGATGRSMDGMNEEWLETVMGLMAEIIAAVYSNEERMDEERESRQSF